MPPTLIVAEVASAIQQDEAAAIGNNDRKSARQVLKLMDLGLARRRKAEYKDESDNARSI
jgi:hypothetical protein